MFSTFVGLGRFINCQRPDYTLISPSRTVLEALFCAEILANCAVLSAFSVISPESGQDIFPDADKSLA